MLGTVYQSTKLGKCKLWEEGKYKFPISAILEYYSSLTFWQGYLLSSTLNCSLIVWNSTVEFHLNVGFQRELARLLIYQTLCHLLDFITSAHSILQGYQIQVLAPKGAINNQTMTHKSSNGCKSFWTACHNHIIWTRNSVAGEELRQAREGMIWPFQTTD